MIDKDDTKGKIRVGDLILAADQIEELRRAAAEANDHIALAAIDSAAAALDLVRSDQISEDAPLPDRLVEDLYCCMNAWSGMVTRLGRIGVRP